MRLTLYILGMIFSISAILLLFPIINTNNTGIIGYGIETAFLFGGIAILTAAIRDYRGGLQFLSGIIMLSIYTCLAWHNIVH